ncbi:membrane protein [Gordonia phage Neville]|uniref:Membrane protein n=2 Tax=Nevillevirus TaxID=3044773 RepID=A0A515MGY8_9CAUD|nr:membrane protein [Gordonia phage Neville]YP_010246024.1 membrane protein [Gordonia phage Trax]AXQ64411.1 membrane protein [Gordonia phage Neville]QDM55926.1 membrane protein [Gordonia phage Trax]
MLTPLINLVTLIPSILLGAACYQRRRFWRHRACAAANYGLALIALGCLLISPTHDFISEATGRHFDMWRTDLLAGVTLVMVGLHLLLLHLADTISLLDEQLAQTASATLAFFVTLLWIGFFIGGLNHQPGTTEFPAPGRNAFWFVFSIWLVIVCSVCLGYAGTILELAEDSGMRTVATWYLLAAVFGIIVGAHRLLGIMCNIGQRLPQHILNVDYSLRALAIATLVIAAHQSFRQLTKPLVIPEAWPPPGYGKAGSDDALAE